MSKETNQPLPDGQEITEILDQIEKEADESQRANRIAEIAARLVEESDLKRVLTLVSAIKEEESRARALRPLFIRLTPDLRPVGLGIAQGFQDDKIRKASVAAFGRSLESEESGVARFARKLANAVNGPWLMSILSIFAALLVTGVLAWLLWFELLLDLWAWGYDEFTWRSLVAWLPAFYLAIIPVFGLLLIPMLIDFWQEYGSVSKQVQSARKAQEKLEEQLLRNDPQKLILIIGYSRQMLSEYYGIAMSQAQRSFRYCLIAMWLGFFILIAGVADHFLPLGQILSTSLGLELQFEAANRGASLTPNELVLVTGVVIEFIAAAFLWVYRFSIQQQTFYYQRQLRLHNALLAHRVAEGMTVSKDDAIKLVVERLLQDIEMTQMAGPSAAGLSKFFKSS